MVFFKTGDPVPTRANLGLGPIDIHTWFGLSYANYLVIPRSVLQSMPPEWQHKLTRLLEEYGDACLAAGLKIPSYRVQAVKNGAYIKDDLADYERGRRDVLEGITCLVPPADVVVSFDMAEKSPMEKAFGSWPGDETDEELSNALKEDK